MNILFYSPWDVAPKQGGTERITATISTALRRRYGYKCYLAYRYDTNPDFQLTFFDGKIKLKGKRDREKLLRFMIDNNIQIMINQGDLKNTKFLKSCLPNGAKLFTCYHFYPGAEYRLFNFSEILFKYNSSKRIVDLINVFLFPVKKILSYITIPLYYNNAYRYSDKIILLSTNFIEDFKRVALIKEIKKITYLPNALSFYSFANVNDINKKEKIVLVVARMNENQKRILSILQVWNSIYETTQKDNWQLIIIGQGKDLNRYIEYKNKNKLNNIDFLGSQDPEPFYKRASIFLMASAFEGWGLTITEAQQYGVVPIAFDTYKSLPDIITNGINGYLIPNNDFEAYGKLLTQLMSNEKLRKSIAVNCVKLSKRYSIDVVANSWQKLINN